MSLNCWIGKEARQRTCFLLLAMFSGGLLFQAGCDSGSNQYDPPPPPGVVVAHPVQQDVTIFIEEIGEAEPVDDVEVRARVPGFIELIQFEPGQEVGADDVLYEIERDQYQAAKDSAAAALAASAAAVSVAEANQEIAEAEVQRTERDFKRQAELLESNAISPADYDQALSARDSAAASLTASKAAIEAAKAEQQKAAAALAQTELDLNYTNVRAPIAGRVTKTFVKKGNLVESGTQLARIIDDSRIFINFSISDRLLLQLREVRPRSETDDSQPEDWRKIPVLARTEGPQAEWIEGRLEYVDQEGVDRDTGTFALRADFDNGDDDLVPGLFVQVRVPVERREGVILIPLQAVQRTQLGDSILVVKEDKMVERRDVRLGTQLDRWVIVEEGIGVEETFVYEGLLRARPGAPVDPSQVELDTKDSPLLQIDLPLPEDQP